MRVNASRVVLRVLLVLAVLLPTAPIGASAATLLLSDQFSRTVSNTWGTATTGGKWTLSGTASNYRVSSNKGEAVTPIGATRLIKTAAAGADVDLTTLVDLSSRPTGGGLYLSLGTRSNGTAAYVTRLRFYSDGAVALHHQMKAPGVLTTLPGVVLSGLTYQAGQQLNVRTQVQGYGPATLRSKVWRAGTTEPQAWQLTLTNSDTRVPKSGTIYSEQFLSGTATSPVTVRYDSISASTIDSTSTNRAPIASFTATAAGLKATVNGSASSDPDGTIASYAWNFGDGSTGTGSSFSRTYAAPGTYTITLTVTDDKGATATTTRQVTVANLAPNASFTATASGLVASVNGSASADSDGTIASYAWDFGDGSTGSGASTSRAYTAAGTYTITLTVTDNTGAKASTTRQVTVAVRAPTASFTVSISGQKVTANGSASSDPDGAIASYAWDFGDGSTGTGVSTSRTYATAGTYTIRLTVTDNSGATGTMTRQVTLVNQSPTAFFTRTVNDPTVSVNASGSTDADGTIASYAWDFGDGTTATDATSSRTYAAAGVYRITLTVTDNAGASATATRDITITTPANQAPTAAFTRTATGLTVSVNGNSSSDPDGSIANYEWDFGDGTSDSGALANHIYANASTYTITLTVTDNKGAKDTLSRVITVSSAPNEAPTASFTTVIDGLTVSVDASASADTDGTIADYEWSFGEGAADSGVAVDHTFDTEGTYTITLRVTDDRGGVDIKTRSVTVPPGGDDNQPPSAVFTRTVSGSTVTVDASASSDTDGTITGYAWSFGDGATGEGVSASHVYETPGTYTIILTVTDDDLATGSATRTATIAAPAGESPTAAITLSRQGMKVTVNGSGSSDPDGTISAYLWSFGDGATSTAMSTNHTYTDVGTYAVTLKVTDNSGDTDTASRTVTVGSPTVPAADTTGVPEDTDLKRLSTSTLPYPADTFTATTFAIKTPNAVYDGWRFDRIVQVQAPGVVIRNSYFEGIAANPLNSALLVISNDRSKTPVPSATVEDSTLIPISTTNPVDGIRGSNVTVRRVEITDTVDGVHVFGSLTNYTDPYAGNVVVNQSWIHDLISHDDGTAVGTHNDAVQIVGGSNISITNNRFDGALFNASIQVTQKYAAVTGLTVSGNMLTGGVCTVNMADKAGPAAFSGITISGNTFERGTTKFADCAIAISKRSRPGVSALDNVWSNGSQPPPAISTTVEP